ncbi:hypothetical protein ACRAVF_27235 [Bradyrhizobium oligotrophicum S58]
MADIRKLERRLDTDAADLVEDLADLRLDDVLLVVPIPVGVLEQIRRSFRCGLPLRLAGLGGLELLLNRGELGTQLGQLRARPGCLQLRNLGPKLVALGFRLTPRLGLLAQSAGRDTPCRRLGGALGRIGCRFIARGLPVAFAVLAFAVRLVVAFGLGLFPDVSSAASSSSSASIWPSEPFTHRLERAVSRLVERIRVFDTPRVAGDLQLGADHRLADRVDLFILPEFCH